VKPKIQDYSLLSIVAAAAELVSINCKKIALSVSANNERIKSGHGLVPAFQVSSLKYASSAIPTIFLTSNLILEYLITQTICRRISMN